MRTLFRIIVAVFSAIATYYFTYWFGGALLDMAGLAPWSHVAVAALATALVMRYVWVQTDSLRAGLARSVFLGAIVTGAIPFVAGFFGPIIFTPDANQGPLLGIFITGPLGALLGGMGGAVSWFVRERRGHTSTGDPAA